MRLLFSILIVSGLIALFLYIWSVIGAPWLEGNLDEPKEITLMLISLAVMVTVFVILFTFVIPDLAQGVGNLFYTPARTEATENKYATALSAQARGDYEEAVQAYLEIAQQDPEDIHAVCEAAKIRANRLDDPDSAMELLSEYLDAGHEPEAASQLAFMLADIAKEGKQDYDYAAVVLRQVIETMPATPQALHAAQEIRRMEQKGQIEPAA